jgi:tricorn protease
VPARPWRIAVSSALLAAAASNTGDVARAQSAPPDAHPAVVASANAAARAGALAWGASPAETRIGYYRFPAIHGGTLVFTAEGDLWRVPVAGGVAQRLTSHPGEETRAAVSADGRTVAFSGAYDGAREVYTMPLDGGVPVRHTFDGGAADVVGWTPDGAVLYTTTRYATLPNAQLIAVDPATNARAVVPLAQASDGAYAPDGALVFTRLAKQPSHTRRYVGGTVQNLWRWAGRMGEEAAPLTGDYLGTSRSPMVWDGRVYFASDRDPAGAPQLAAPAAHREATRAAVMNLWSMRLDGGDVRRHTQHADYDVLDPKLHDGRIVYQHGADLRLLDVRTGDDRRLDIRLASDFATLRERWVTRPMEYLTSWHVSPDGERVALTARGQVFVAPVGAGGRLVEASRHDGVRYRDALFMSDGRSLLALSDESGELELWTLPANGVGPRARLTDDGDSYRTMARPAPDGRRIAHGDRFGRLWVYDAQRRTNTLVAEARQWAAGFVTGSGAAWSADSRWLAFAMPGENDLQRIMLYDVERDALTAITSDRYASYAPAWSPDGKWLWFLSDRTFRSAVSSPWGVRAPEPFFDTQTKIYALALEPGTRFPFAARTELEAGSGRAATPATPVPAPAQTPAPGRTPPADGPAQPAGAAAAPASVVIRLEGLAERLYELPVPAGNYFGLTTDGPRLYWGAFDRAANRSSIQTLTIGNDGPPDVETFAENVTGFQLTADRKKLAFRRGEELFVVPAGARAPQELARHRVNLAGWSFAFDPREEFRQMFVESWRLQRDWFYDAGLHGVDYAANLAKYAPLAERVTDRAELADAIAQMVAELSALHIYVYGGDTNRCAGAEQAALCARMLPASLGAVLEKDPGAGGWRIAHIYRSDPDRPTERAPLERPGVEVARGDVIVSINGVPTLSVEDPAVLLRNQAGRQVLLRVASGGGGGGAGGGGGRANAGAGAGGPAAAGAARDVIVEPVALAEENRLRYDEWRYTRRLLVDSLSGGRIGYVHLRAMGPNDIADFTRDYYPVFNREALIVDVRHNGGGNIDAWILSRLMRRPWMYWQPRSGEPYWNFHYAFHGPMVALQNERTASDGEAFTEGFRRLGLGKVIGTRSWGGEIWLTSSNFLVDRGIATAAEIGVYGPEGEWLIEGWGVDPDVLVDNLPHATFLGRDAQIERAVAELMAELERAPVRVPRVGRQGGEER